jgi:hypothetical protein
MTDWPAFLLIAGSALVLHVVLSLDIVGQFRVLPTELLERYWVACQRVAVGWTLWVRTILALLFAGVPTALMVFSIFRADRAGGGTGVVISAVELALATAWVRYLITRSRGPRPR